MIKKMKGEGDECITRNLISKYCRNESPPRKVNTLFSGFLEKEEEIALYRDRLKELETAFCYNLELISERDLELSILERELSDENEQLHQVIQERDELESLLKAADSKNCRKILQLERRLTLKDEEIRELQRENISNVATLKKIINDIKQHQHKQTHKLTVKFEIQKNELIKGYREEMEEKEKYYLLEIDNLAGKFEEVYMEKERLMKTEEENRSLKYHLADIERLFQKKEDYYLEELKKMNKIGRTKDDKEVQCKLEVQVDNKTIQVEPKSSAAESQTSGNHSDSEGYYKQKINFLEEQNEILKYVIKDLKKNRDNEVKTEGKHTLPVEETKCVECKVVKAEVEEVKKKFEKEIGSLKKILVDEQKQRADEELMIQSLETSVTSLKERLLEGLQEKLEDFAGDDICSYTYNRELQNEIKVSLLEQKLSKKIDVLSMTAEEERKKLNDKLEELKKECLEKMEKALKPKEDVPEMKSENLLEKIRLEIQKLENKIESDMKNIIRNNCEMNKCDKTLQTRVEFTEKRETLDPRAFPVFVPRSGCLQFEKPREGYYKNDIFPEKCVLKTGRESARYQEEEYRKRGQKGFRKLTNDLVMGKYAKVPE